MNISANYHISVIICILYDGYLPALSFDILHATVLEFSGLVHSPSCVSEHESTAYAIVKQ